MSDLPRQFGPYTLLKLLAKGGMGEIYLARTQGISHFEKYYAIKKLLKKFARDQDVGARFIDEAKLGARLQHPNIVQVYDLGAMGEELFMATEFVDGFDLRRVLRFCHEKKKRIPLDIALFIVKEVLSGLAYAHRQLDADGQSINLIHRDISPQNVLVSFEGEVKIIDFGLAKSTQRSQETQANVLLGNFGYMSPEQARGQKLDVRTDIYSTGIVLFELVTRTKRFVDENPLRLLEMVARPTPVMPSDRAPDVPKKIDHIYSQATAPAKEERFESADAFRQEVTTALHRINPHASREHLAQFLNHLFLGGQAPPQPDNEALDKSVAVQVHDLYQQSEAFRRTKEQDAQDRRLSQFSDEAPQTGSHNLMRACRVGDTLTHAELTGEEGEPGGAAAASPDVELELGRAKEPAPAEAAPPPSLDEAEAEEPPATEQQPAMQFNEAPPPEIASAPTNVYEAPEWSGQPTGEFTAPGAAADPEPVDDEQLEPLELGEADFAPAPEEPQVQAQLQAELDAQIHARVGEGAPHHDTLQAIPTPEEEVLPDGMMPTPGAEAFATKETGKQPAPPRPSAEAQEAPVDPAARPPDAAALDEPSGPVDPQARPPDPSAFPGRGGAVVTTVVGARGQEPRREEEEPTMVVDMDSMAEPEARRAAAEREAGGPESMPPPSGNAFTEGRGESLIIDFDLSDMDSEEEAELPPPEGAEEYEEADGGPAPEGDDEEAMIRPAASSDPVIRPAATPARRPKGRPVRDINPRKRRQ